MYGGRAHRLELDDNATVGDLRRAVQERTRVRRSRQALAPADPAVAARPEVRLGLTIDATKLKALKLNQNCRMTLGGEADDADRDIFDPQASTAERERAQAAREEAARRSQSEPRRFRDLPQLERAQHYRDQGNEAFGAGFSQRAADLYTRAINAVGARAGRADGQLAEKCLSNRAACYLKLRRYAEAACDAQRATELNPSWAKPYNRLGQALLMLQRCVCFVKGTRSRAHAAPSRVAFRPGRMKETGQCSESLADTVLSAPCGILSRRIEIRRHRCVGTTRRRRRTSAGWRTATKTRTNRSARATPARWPRAATRRARLSGARRSAKRPRRAELPFATTARTLAST